jgi:hypothetical protein
MPSMAVLTAFVEEASRRMVEAVQPYYDAVEEYGPTNPQTLAAQTVARAELEAAVRQNHIDAAVIGAGGDLSGDAKSVLQDIIGTDTYYVERFADDLPNLSRGQALVRADLYVSTQQNTITDITSLELPTLPIYPKDKRLECTTFCTCMLDIRFLFGNGNFDVYWNLDPGVKEACEDCITLSQSWRPLQIRDGQVLGGQVVKQHDVKIMKAVLDKVRAAA